MKTIILLIFYFGKFPDFFPLFLKSCGDNPQLTWRIYTDNTKDGNWPANVEYRHMTFEQCRELFQSRFPFDIRLDFPGKLCDYKPACGYILEEELSGYDFWGHCDLDVIFGDIKKFLPEKLLDCYDKLFTLGHFTLYRNVPECSRYFMTFDGGRRCREVFQKSELVGFDEWSVGNINEIFRKSEFRFYDKSYGADIWPEKTAFCLSEYNPVRDRYQPVVGTSGIFWKNENRLYLVKDSHDMIEYPYVHFQKRNLEVCCSESTKDYYIVPGRFLPSDTDRADLIRRECRPRLIDRQFLKIKLRNIKHRLHIR